MLAYCVRLLGARWQVEGQVDGRVVRVLGLGHGGNADGRRKVGAFELRVHPTDPLVEQGRELVFCRLPRAKVLDFEDGRQCLPPDHVADLDA